MHMDLYRSCGQNKMLSVDYAHRYQFHCTYSLDVHGDRYCILYTIILDSVMFLTTSANILTKLARVLPLVWMLITESSTFTLFTSVVVLVRVIRTLFLTTGLTVVFHVSMFTFDFWVALRTLTLWATLPLRLI
jgi:hypothetical protein